MTDAAPQTGQLQAYSLTSLAQQEIERMILGGEYTPGERINENTLANQLGISRGPVREACHALAAIGLVQLIPNRGVFVRVISEDDARDVYEMRAGVFGYAGMLIASRISDDQLTYLSHLVSQMEIAIQTNNFDNYYAPNLAFHEFLISATDNQRLINTYHDLVRQLHLFRARGLVASNGMRASNSEHRDIVEALTTRNPQRAFATMSEHVHAGKQRALSPNSTHV